MFSTKALRSIVLLCVLLAAPSLSSAIPIVFTDVDSIVAGVSAFRDAIGGVNNGNAAGPFTTGRREINWDGGGAAAPGTSRRPSRENRKPLLFASWRAPSGQCRLVRRVQRRRVALARATAPSQRALGLTVRACVTRSTATRPKVVATSPITAAAR